LLLAELYNENLDVSKYWVSEKLDGVRAYWDGKQLVTRGGQVIAAPAWFVADFPKTALDGELWLGRNQFAQTMSILSKIQPIDTEWQQIRYHVFELPNAQGTFTERIQAMQALVDGSKSSQTNRYWQIIPQFRLLDHRALIAKLQELEQQGAEGLMLHHQDALYKTGRSSDLLKLKSYQDSEAEVIGYRPGKGKYQGMVGALVVKMPDGKTFAIGSGLTDALRQNPPAIGTLVTYRYNGFTKKGLPRFARFMRVREDLAR
jgi:DNA ligase-1